MSAIDLLEWNDVLPDVRMVEENMAAATRTWMVVADYGWAERILCTGCEETDAEAIVAAIKQVTGKWGGTKRCESCKGAGWIRGGAK